MTRHHCKTADGRSFYLATIEQAERFVAREGGEYVGQVDARPIVDAMLAELAQKGAGR